MTFQAELDKINKTRKRDRLGQISTPPHVSEFMAEIVTGNDKDLTDKLVLDPCVGTGNLLIPMRGRGAILVGIDIDKEALEMCKERIPEAILTSCNSLLCFNPAKVLRMGKESIEELEKELSELNQKEKTDQKEKNRINKIPLEIEKWKETIEKEKLRKPWKYGLYCSEHVFHEPPETIKQLERKIEDDKKKEQEQLISDLRKFQQAEIKKLRDFNNGGQPIYYTCKRCKAQEIDEKIGQGKDGSYPLCMNCWKGEWQGDFSELKTDDLVKWMTEQKKKKKLVN